MLIIYPYPNPDNQSSNKYYRRVRGDRSEVSVEMSIKIIDGCGSIVYIQISVWWMKLLLKRYVRINADRRRGKLDQARPRDCTEGKPT